LKATEYIEYKINRLPKGYVFTYLDFITDANKKEAVIKALNRMAASDIIKKLSKGKYYRPENTVFGNLLPEQSQIVKDLLVSDGKINGYLTGYSIYNKLGLTTQISNIIQIGRNEIRPPLRLGRFKVLFIKQKNVMTAENIPLLQILDAIRYIKKIPDSTVEFSCRRIMAIINDLQKNEKTTMARLAQKYSPFTRALLGALLESSGNGSMTENLKKSLNPITIYKIPGVQIVLPASKNWNIK
jgi:hypothetical protein